MIITQTKKRIYDSIQRINEKRIAAAIFLSNCHEVSSHWFSSDRMLDVKICAFILSIILGFEEMSVNLIEIGEMNNKTAADKNKIIKSKAMRVCNLIAR